jgi:hypothetical protein
MGRTKIVAINRETIFMISGGRTNFIMLISKGTQKNEKTPTHPLMFFFVVWTNNRHPKYKPNAKGTINKAIPAMTPTNIGPSSLSLNPEETIPHKMLQSTRLDTRIRKIAKPRDGFFIFLTPSR